jgi:hypothetical protein
MPIYIDRELMFTSWYKALATGLSIWYPVESDTKIHYLQRECIVRLVVVRRQGLLKSPGEIPRLSFLFIDHYVPAFMPWIHCD